MGCAGEELKDSGHGEGVTWHGEEERWGPRRVTNTTTEKEVSSPNYDKKETINPEKHSNGCGAPNAMRPYGYEDDLVLKKVNELLDLYVGNWSFIEESSYQVLLESILDQEEQQQQLWIQHSQMDGISETSLVIHKSDDKVDTLVPPSVEGGSSQDINLDKSSEKRHTASPNANESKQPADSFPIRRRRPYHGFISNGQDEPELVDFGTSITF
ncbi:hypothetical protein Patl1_06562 [Pistacia atlantica]|uniref:Uncharacterized protein n=1 Tax=Pistacia atlantica TaxID=434234 RepID=A0ACC1BWJ4_9ROSI|nr:hypothetical protein Patl1_06562 [Pistacia atlantica]